MRLRSSAQPSWHDLADSVRIKKCYLITGVNSHRMTLSLTGLYVSAETFYFHFTLSNRSRLSYPVELMRLFIHDETNLKRSSLQERELPLLYADSLTLLPPGSCTSFVMVTPQFTMPEARSCVLEVMEAGGGRHIRLPIRNRHLFLAKPLNDSLAIPFLHPSYEKIFRRFRAARTIR